MSNEEYNFTFDAARKIAQGGTAEILLTEDDSNGKRVVKVLHGFLDTKDMLERFNRECAMHSRFFHAGIVRCLAHGIKEGRPYLLMEYGGKDFKSVRQKALAVNKRFSLDQTFNLGLNLFETLRYLHDEQNIVHADINPSNILVSADGQVKLCDFGMAIYAGEDVFASETLNNIAYLAPEYAEGTKLDQGADLFAVFVILWEMLSGSRLFKGKNRNETLDKVLRCNVLPVSDQSCPTVINDFICSNLSPAKSERIAASVEVIEELQKIMKLTGTKISESIIFE